MSPEPRKIDQKITKTIILIKHFGTMRNDSYSFLGYLSIDASFRMKIHPLIYIIV